MARTVRNAKLDTRSARSKLAVRREPYWVVIAKGCALGYRRGGNGGIWIARFRGDAGKQTYHALGAADDAMDADENAILSYAEAQRRADAWFSRGRHLRRGDPSPPLDGKPGAHRPQSCA